MTKLFQPPSDGQLAQLLGESLIQIWTRLCQRIENKYDMERAWNSGGKAWVYEYKYRRGGKTLCALYAKGNRIGFMVILGKQEREAFEAIQGEFKPEVQEIYWFATTFHDGKWLMFELEDDTLFDEYLSFWFQSVCRFCMYIRYGLPESINRYLLQDMPRYNLTAFRLYIGALACSVPSPVRYSQARTYLPL